MATSAFDFFIKFSAILLISLFAAIIAANRTDNEKDRNDTAAYAAHYYCISSHKTLDQCRNEIGGNKYEFLYEQFIGFLAQDLNLNYFYYIKIATALAIYSTILLAVGLQSRNTPLSLLILLLDFRFWEYGSNVLRHGFAAAFIAMGALLLTRNQLKLSIIAKFFAVISHLSAAIVLFTPTKKHKTWVLTSFAVATLAFFLTSEYWITALLASNLVDYKIDYYLRNADGYNFSLPTHYAIFIFFGLFCYYKTESKLFITTFNYLIPLFLASVILGYLDASYRMTSFMLPILAVNIPEQISILTNKLKEKELAEKICSGLIITLMTFIAYKNWDFFLIHLG